MRTLQQERIRAAVYENRKTYIYMIRRMNKDKISFIRKDSAKDSAPLERAVLIINILQRYRS